MALQPVGDGCEDDVQLDERGTAEAVDHHQHVAGQRQVGVDGVQGDAGDLPRGDERAAGTAGFAVDADAELDLVFAQLEAGLSGRGYRARGQRHAERAGPVVDLTGQPGGRGQVRAPFGRGAHDLLHEDRRAGTAAARGPGAVLHRHVVVDHDRLDADPVVVGQFRGHLEVEHVAGVVLDDVQHPGPGVDRLGGGQDLVRYRRGEHLTRAGGVEHPVPDVPAVQRLVSRPAAGHQAHLARRRPLRPRDEAFLQVHRQRRVRGADPGQRVDQYLVGCVDKLLHG